MDPPSSIRTSIHICHGLRQVKRWKLMQKVLYSVLNPITPSDLVVSLEFGRMFVTISCFVIPPTQIRFPIGGDWSVTCLGSNLTNSLGGAKLTNSKTQIRFPIGGDWSVTCLGSNLTNFLGGAKLPKKTTWTFDSHVIRSFTLKRRQICVPVTLQRFSLEKAFIIQQEKWFIIRQRHIRLTKGKIWTFDVFKLLIWRQKWIARVRQLALRSLSSLPR